MKRIISTIALAATVLLGGALLPACEAFPSGCVRLAEYELPEPYVYNAPSQSIIWYHGLPIQQTFVGISGSNPHTTYSFTYHGPSQYTGWDEYRSAYRCWQTGGGTSTP